MEQQIFFDTWISLGRVFVVGTLAYAALVLMLRISGKRTLSKMNAFDLIVTIALGSTLATVLLNRSVPLAEGVAALALLIALQFAITWVSARSDTWKQMVKAEPTVLLTQGNVVDDALLRERLTFDEVQAAVRQAGHPEVDETITVILETDGSLSVLQSREAHRLFPHRRVKSRSASQRSPTKRRSNDCLPQIHGDDPDIDSRDVRSNVSKHL
ncbi:YetF domain-containing protein [Mesorhizobium sp. YIM 152430]|uniref:DUF421 domain-containing protein n=1 Tax=Mesorhizobium sp. YIM 152430 TaxID=3031761 RepID=UPI0031F3BAFD